MVRVPGVVGRVGDECPMEFVQEEQVQALQ